MKGKDNIHLTFSATSISSIVIEMGRKGIQIQTLNEVNGATQTYATHAGSSSELTCVGKPTLEYAIQVKKGNEGKKHNYLINTPLNPLHSTFVN